MPQALARHAINPAPCTAPPDLPCRPDCRGWHVLRSCIEPCLACDHWPRTDEGAAAVVMHVLEHCPACADLAIEAGAIEPIVGLFDGMDFQEVEGGWRAGLHSRGKLVIQTAVYPDREDARAAAKLWLRRLRNA